MLSPVLTDLFKCVHQDVFVYTDGSEVDYSFWSAGQPDNFTGEEDCVEVKPKCNEKILQEVLTVWPLLLRDVPLQTYRQLY